MTTLNLQVGANNDDAQQLVSTGAMTLDAAENDFGNHTNPKHVGIRFTGVSGLSGATIDSAILIMRAVFSDTGGFVGDWYAHDAASPGTFTSTTSNISDTAQRPRTTATCEGDGSDFGDWTSGQDETFTGDGVSTIADIIQELADSYDPSEIALLHIYTSGNGERRARAHDGGAAFAPKLDIDFTVVGAQTLTPSGIASLEAFGAATVTLDLQTITAGAIASAEAFGSAQLNLAFTASGIASLEAFGGATISTAVTLTPSGIPSAETFGSAVLTTTVSISAGGIASAEVFGSAQLNLAFTASGIASLEAFGAATISTTVTITASGIASLEAFGAATVTTGVIFSAYGNWRALIDPGDYPTGAEFFFEAIIATSDANFPSYAHLYNITDAAVVADSQVQSVDTTDERVRSSALSLPAAPKEYRCERGGAAGATYKCYGARVLAKSG